MQTKIIERYFFFGLFFATLLFTFLIFRPFWIVLVLGISFSIVLYPIYTWLVKKSFPKMLAVLFTILFFIIVVCGPLLGMAAIIFNQSQDVYHFVVDNGGPKPFFDKVDTAVNQVLPAGIHFNSQEKSSYFVSYLSSNVANIFSTTLSAFFSFLLLILIIFYFLKDGTNWRESLVVLSPLSDKNDETIITRLEHAVKSVIIGNLLVAIIQGVLMGVGLWLFGVPNGALWGVVAAVCSLVPTFGTALVSVPAIIFLFVTDNTASAIGLIIWATVAVGMIDNFLSPILVARRTNIPPLLILFSVLGGISLLGPVGILVGPLTVSLLYTLISIYRNDFKQNAAV